MEMCAVSRKDRDFYAKNDALTNVESHQWEEVVNYKSQFDCYRAALEAAGKPVIAQYVYCPVNRMIVGIS